jgi:hypothetical protein
MKAQTRVNQLSRLSGDRCETAAVPGGKEPSSNEYCIRPSASCVRLFRHTSRWAASVERWTASVTPATTAAKATVAIIVRTLNRTRGSLMAGASEGLIVKFQR